MEAIFFSPWQACQWRAESAPPSAVAQRAIIDKPARVKHAPPCEQWVGLDAGGLWDSALYRPMCSPFRKRMASPRLSRDSGARSLQSLRRLKEATP